MKYLRLWAKSFALELSSEMAYKWNFFIKMLALMMADVVGPLVIMFIYTNTPGIPGWSFEEFLLFQGTGILVFGLAHFLLILMPYKVIEMVKEGTFDKVLIKPFDPLLYMTFSSMDLEGIAEVAVGVALVAYSMNAIGVTLGLNFALYLALVALAFLFQYAMMIMVASLAFLVVKSFALMDLIFKLGDFARYPLNVYDLGLRAMLTFVFPIAVSAFYPVEVLLRGLRPSVMALIAAPVLIFLGVSVMLWKLAMRKYTSAGG